MKKHFNDMYPKNLALGEMIHDAIHSLHCGLTLAVMERDKCGRLWIQRKIGENHYREYVPGSQDQIKVLVFNQEVRCDPALFTINLQSDKSHRVIRRV
jgi:hypothetical protein